MTGEVIRTTPTQTARRRDLIDATITAISEHGLPNLTLSKVAANAGLSAGSVNFHFTSKDALLLATLRHVSEELEQAVEAAVEAAGDDPGAALEAIARASLDPVLTEPRKLAVWYAFIAEAHARQDYQRICGERDATYFQRILELCQRLIDQRETATPLNAEAVAYGFAGLLEALWQEILFSGTDYDRETAARTWHRYLASVFPWRFDMPGASASTRNDSGSAPTLAPVREGALVYTLPSWVYEHDEFFALEREHIFMPAWQLVCHTSEIPSAGDYVTYELLGERAFVMRGEDGAVRAFHNVCRHRAHAVVQGRQGHCPGYIRCPYHGWTYHLDGRNRAVSARDSFPALDPAAFGLKPIEAEVLLGFVFIRFHSGGPTLAERFAPVREEFAHYRTEDMQVIPFRAETHPELWLEPVAVDWKNGVENYVEDYHFPIGHRGLTALMEREYEREAFATGLVRLSHTMREQPLANWSVERYHALLPDYAHLPEAMRRRWTYYALFPNTFFDLFPEQMDCYQIVPVAPGRSLLRGRSYALPDDRRETRAVRYLGNRINVRVQDEDNDLTTSVQAGLRSSAYDVGILSAKENMVQAFQDWVRERIPAARLLEPPAPGGAARLAPTAQRA